MRRLLVFAVLAAAPAIAASCTDQENPSFDAPPPSEDGGFEDAAEVDGSVTGDPSKGILLEGTVIGEEGPFEGMVLVGTDGLIACAEPGQACAEDPNADGVARVNVNGVIAPGLIDAHNHILFDIFDGDDWLPEKAYQNHDQWPNEAKYKEMVDIKQCIVDDSQGKPTWCPDRLDGAGSLRCEVFKYGEVKGVVAGTTSIVGLAGTSFPCFATLARAVDTQFNGLGADKIQTSAVFPSNSTADGVCRNFADGKTDAYLIHVGEGVDQKSLDEWTKLGTLTTTPGCLYAPQTAITHGTALTQAEFAEMGAKGMKLVWSPASNYALYGEGATTNVPLALDNGIVVAVAPDWSMGGSRNMLDELRFARKVSLEKWNGRLSARDVVEMGTKNAAVAIALADKLGTIKKGYQADLFVVPKTGGDAYDAILAATPKEVRLTMVGGKALYGDEALRPLAAYGPACEELDACGASKFLCVAIPGKTDNKLNQTFEQIQGILEGALKELDEVRVTVGGKADGLKFSPLTPVVGCAE